MNYITDWLGMVAEVLSIVIGEGFSTESEAILIECPVEEPYFY